MFFYTTFLTLFFILFSVSDALALSFANDGSNPSAPAKTDAQIRQEREEAEKALQAQQEEQRLATLDAAEAEAEAARLARIQAERDAYQAKRRNYNFVRNKSGKYGWEIENFDNLYHKYESGTPNKAMLDRIKSANKDKSQFLVLVGHNHSSDSNEYSIYASGPLSVAQGKKIIGRYTNGSIDYKKFAFLNDDSFKKSDDCIDFTDDTNTEVDFVANDFGRCIIVYILHNVPDFIK